MHLYIGEEAVAAGVCAHLEDRDYATSTHRGHGHFLAKGGDVRAMMAEIWAKREGICRGMGGSMHVADISKGILGANGIVGAGLSIATGAAFGAKLDGDGKVAVCFFGDGASNQGVLMETLNVSALWGLPVVFVCENNGFSEFTPSAEVTSGRIADRARAFAVPVAEVDGNDVTAVWRAAGEAVSAGARRRRAVVHRGAHLPHPGPFRGGVLRARRRRVPGRGGDRGLAAAGTRSPGSGPRSTSAGTVAAADLDADRGRGPPTAWRTPWPTPRRASPPTPNSPKR